MPRRFWSKADIATVAALYPSRPTKEIAARLNRSILSVYQLAQKLGIKKSAEFLASEESGILRKGQTRPEGVPHQFQKGQVPPNKGLRRPGWHRGRMKETQFKKGVLSGIAAKRWVPIGTIKTDPDGYLRIKVREAIHGQEPTGFGNSKVWPMYQRVVWEQHNGPIPPSHAVAFKDKNRQNCAIENLECISRAELARRNQMWNNLPRELAHVIQLNGALKRKLRKYGKKQAE